MANVKSLIRLADKFQIEYLLDEIKVNAPTGAPRDIIAGVFADRGVDLFGSLDNASATVL